VKPREPRRKVLIRARMRTGAVWGDVCLLNMSSRGALAQAAAPPPKGTYIEVRRGSRLVVARVVWTDKHRFGVCTQDPIAVEDFIADPDGSKTQSSSAEAPHYIERRAAPRKPTSTERHERSRTFGRCIEFCFVVGLGSGLAALAFGLAEAALAVPMSSVSTALASR
jgi:hypothetical protein